MKTQIWDTYFLCQSNEYFEYVTALNKFSILIKQLKKHFQINNQQQSETKELDDRKLITNWKNTLRSRDRDKKRKHKKIVTVTVEYEDLKSHNEDDSILRKIIPNLEN